MLKTFELSGTISPFQGFTVLLLPPGYNHFTLSGFYIGFKIILEFNHRNSVKIPKG
jgi:hypothetical protein